MKPEDPTGKASPPHLAAAIGVEAQGMGWTITDLREILQHQLSAPLRADLARLSSAFVHRFDAFAGISNGTLSLGDILSAEVPELQQLYLIKDFAKRAIAPDDASLPEEVGAILYYASISCAWLKLNARIHSLNDLALKTGLSWVVQQAWVPPQLQALFRTHLDQLAEAMG